LVTAVLVSLSLLFSPAGAVEIGRPSARGTTAGNDRVSSPSASPAAAVLPSAQQQLTRAAQSLQAVRAMQLAARNLALAGSNSLRAGLPAVPLNSYGQAGGLLPAAWP
jgi:hypothetical protein